MFKCQWLPLEHSKLGLKMMVKKSLKSIKSDMMSPLTNPLIEPQTIQTTRRLVKTGRAQNLLDPSTGELIAKSAIHTIEEKDDENFVKVFAAGIAASYELTKTAQKVFQAVLREYEKTPMTGGYADSVELYWFGSGINGQSIGISETTWNRGLRELLDKRFLWPKTSSSYWTNPALFFKGNRVVFIKEYRRKSTVTDRDPDTVDLIAGKTDKEVQDEI
jgi:hypothetical protein